VGNNYTNDVASPIGIKTDFVLICQTTAAVEVSVIQTHFSGSNCKVTSTTITSLANPQASAYPL